MQHGDSHRRQGYENIEENEATAETAAISTSRFIAEPNASVPPPPALEAEVPPPASRAATFLPAERLFEPLSPLPQPHGMQQVFLRRHFDPYQKSSSVRGWVGGDTGA